MYRAPFLLHSLLGSACAVVVFGVAGISVLRVLGSWTGKHRVPTGDVLLMASAVGMGAFVPISLLFTVILRFSAGSVLLCWILFCAALWLLAKRRPIDSELENRDGPPGVSINAALLLLAGAALAAVAPTSNIYPWIIQGGLYAATPTADHVKVAFTDAIAREGLPLHNPFYAPGGKRILLSYSYGWYVMAAEIKKLTRVTGWEAEVALTWFTSFGIIAFLAAQACRLAGKARAGVWLILLFLVGPISSDLLPLVLGPHWLAVVGLPETHGVELPYLQLAWAPQHEFSALCVVLMIWLMSVALAMPQVRWRYALFIGLMAASGFESSIWVGGVALAAAAPLLIAATLLLRLPARQYVNLGKMMAAAVSVCLIALIPLLIALGSGTAKFQDKPPIGFAIFASTALEDHLGLSGHAKMAARIVLYWIHLLPLSFGAIYVVGFPAMMLWLPRTLSERAWRSMALAATVGFLLVTQFIRSTILENDLGWRAVNVPVMLMAVWAAVAITSLMDRGGAAVANWRITAKALWLREIAATGAIALLTIGLLAMLHLISQPIFVWPPDIEEHRLFAEQTRAWEIVRRYTKPTDLVQANPDAFPKVTQWPISLPYHLLADRATAYACVGTGRTYAFRYSLVDNDRQCAQIREAFHSNAKPATVRALRDQFAVQAIVVTPEDGVWRTKAIERSRVYRCVASTSSYRVYIARAKQKKQKHPSSSGT